MLYEYVIVTMFIDSNRKLNVKMLKGQLKCLFILTQY